MSTLEPVSVAPMIDWTDRHCRQFHRAISRRATLYTEMIVDKAIIHGDRERLLAGSREGVVLQIGGSEPSELKEAVKIAHDYGYSHINLNCGCPSDRVQSGTFGAVLMKTPEKVARALSAMNSVGDVKISIKCRLGVDDQEVEKTLPQFLLAVKSAGVAEVIIHARKAWLQGLSPKENREIPPLDYDLAKDMIKKFPELNIAINGGIVALDDAENFLKYGFVQVMIGRAAYHQPFDVLSPIDVRFYDQKPNHVPQTRHEIVDEMIPYIDEHLSQGGKLHQITRHMIGLFHNQPGARQWRHMLSSEAVKEGADSSLLLRAMPT